MKSFETHSIEQLSQAATWVINNIGESKIIAFYGEMGSGKTTLIKEICKQLKCISLVTSPTFAIINEYQSSDETMIFHFDFYRINKTQELIQIGLDDYLNSGNFCFIEWPEIGETLLPPETLKIKLIVSEKQKRILTIYV
jgi:tRNA threonylcarbamoyladenosine biosynthesis protein TsaE